MKHLAGASALALIAAGAAHAGGLERTPQSMAVLFEQGTYAELSFSFVSPDVDTNTPALGGNSGDMLDSYFGIGAAYKTDINETLSYAIIFDQPYGADTAYPTGTTYAFAGSTAEVNSNAITGVLQYNFGNGASVYGGLRAQTLQAEAVLPAIPGYTIESDTNLAPGYLVGAAFERPDIALRVALTYHSETNHDLELTETGALAVGGLETNTEEVTMPQALNLEFQSGVAEDTLVFGSVRWAEWTETVIDPVVYQRAGQPRPLVFYEDDRITYTLGVGRRLNETWSVLGSVSYEENTGSVTGNLAPTDGFTSVSLGAIYTEDNMKVTGGIRYVDIGDATTFSGGNFTGNTAIAAGLRVGWTF